jgi:hypothetical protein
LPASHANLFEDQPQQLLALSEIQVVQVRHNALGEAVDVLTQPIILDQILALGCQLVAFRGQASAALIHFPCAMLELRQLKEAGLIHIYQPAPLRVSRLEPSAEAAKLGSEQLVIGCWSATRQGSFPGEQHLRLEERLAHLRKNERVKFVGADAVLSATELVTAGPQWITVRADVIAQGTGCAAGPATNGLQAFGNDSAWATPHQATK